MHKHTTVGYNIWPICSPDGYIVDFERAVIGNLDLTPRKALLELCRVLPHKYYCLYAGDLFVNMSAIPECSKLPQYVYLSGIVTKNCAGFSRILLEHACNGSKHLFLNHGEYEDMCSESPSKSVAVF